MKSETFVSFHRNAHSPISIHSLNEEWDQLLIRCFYYLVAFQSTHSMKSETGVVTQRGYMIEFQSTHSMKSETWKFIVVFACFLFQSTHSMKSETFILRGDCDVWSISIHSLNEEWDVHEAIPGRRFNISIHSLNEEWDFWYLLSWGAG